MPVAFSRLHDTDSSSSPRARLIFGIELNDVHGRTRQTDRQTVCGICNYAWRAATYLSDLLLSAEFHRIQSFIFLFMFQSQVVDVESWFATTIASMLHTHTHTHTWLNDMTPSCLSEFISTQNVVDVPSRRTSPYNSHAVQVQPADTRISSSTAISAFWFVLL